jgi:VanZ family protein
LTYSSWRQAPALPPIRIAFFGSIAAACIVSVLPQSMISNGGVGDKLAHALVYFSLALIGAAAFPERRLLPLALAGMGAGLEVLQAFVPGRTAELADAIANACGAGAGALVATGARRLRHARG